MNNRRHKKILEIINNEKIETQEALAKKLLEEGFNVTQATVSRDIRKLNLTKISTNYSKNYYAVLNDIDLEKMEKYIKVLKHGFVSIDIAMNMVVVKTLEGMAMSVAAALDNLNLKEISGSLAGDNTIFIATKSEEDALAVTTKIESTIKKDI